VKNWAGAHLLRQRLDGFEKYVSDNYNEAQTIKQRKTKGNMSLL